MSSEKWTAQPTGIPARGDKALFVDVTDADTNKTTELETFSRIQSATNPYSNLITYAVSDLVEFNDTIFQNTTAVTVAEEFDPEKWLEVNGSSSVVHVRNTIDLPDAAIAAFTSVINNGSGDARFEFTVKVFLSIYHRGSIFVFHEICILVFH